MTVLGKILVGLNFVFSLVAASLFVMSYAARTNWANSHKELKTQYDVAVASADAYAKEAAEARRANELKVDIAQKDLAAATKELTVQKEQLLAAQSNLAATTENLRQAKLAIDSSNAQKNLLAVDSKRLEAAVIAKDEEIKKLLAVGNDLKKDKVNADIARDGFKEMAEGLEKRVRELEVFVKKAKATGVVPAGGIVPASDNPPPEDLEGFVKRDADATGLVLISLGSDAGLLKGHTLEVFRLSPQAKYLGRIKIIEVRPYESVGQVVGKPAAPILKDDRVASKLLK
jgi:multidrug efflux pump subunit AcrA (membrane-fusion protein)